MMGSLLAVLYGLALIGGVFLTYVWGRVFVMAQEEAGGCNSQLCFIALGLTVGSLGNVIIFGWRTWINLTYGPDPRLLQDVALYSIIVGLVILAASKALLMWAYERNRHSLTWKLFMGMSAIWLLTSPFWMLSWETGI